MQLFIRIAGLVCLWLVGTMWASAQFQKPNYNTPSPNAASLGLYGEVPVSLYTGVPNIDIPIYTVEEGKTKVPISLSYHASGVRVNQHPGWVGLNWNLNAGGAITRIVKDAPDDIRESHRTYSKVEDIGYYHNTGILANASWNTTGYLRDQEKVFKDLEPDEFRFSLPGGLSGSFFLNHLQQWQVKCNQAVTVTLDGGFMDIPNDMKIADLPLYEDPNGVGGFYPAQTFKGFQITTTDGTRYYFGGVGPNQEPYIEYSINFFFQRSRQWNADSWYLREIVTPEGQSVRFYYERESTEGKYVASFYPSLNVDVSTVTNSQFFGQSMVCSSEYNVTAGSRGIYAGSLIRPIYLSRIEFSAGAISFNRATSQEMAYPSRLVREHVSWFSGFGSDFYRQYGPFPYLINTSSFEKIKTGTALETLIDSHSSSIVAMFKWKKLTSIEVKDKVGTTTQLKFNFKYNNDDAPTSERLYLNEMRVVSKNDPGCYYSYNFNYYKSGSNPLPEYCDQNGKADHWDFFNNRSFNLMGLYNGNKNDYIQSRSASTDLAVLREGSLEKITYPTGGYTQFEYQPHSIYGFQNLNGSAGISVQTTGLPTVGGLRIYKINSYDGSSVSTKEFEYSFNGGSSGILSGNPVYETMVSAQGAGGLSVSKTYFASNSLLPMGINSQGSHIGYREVKEKLSDGSYRLVKFTNFQSDDGNHLDELPDAAGRIHTPVTMYDAIINKSLERGMLLSEANYRPSGIVSERRLTYAAPTSDFVRAANPFFFWDCTDRYQVFFGTAYKIFTYYYLPLTETFIQYDQDDAGRYTTDVINYSYNVLGLPTQIKVTRNGKTKTTNNKYIVDYTSSDPLRGVFQDEATIIAMQNAGILGLLAEQRIYSNESGSEQLVDGYATRYKRYGTNGSSFINTKPEKIYRYAPTPGIPVNFPVSGSSTKLIVDFDLYDGYTNLGEPQHFKDENQIETRLEWHTGDKTGLLKKKTEGGKTTEFEYQPLVGVSNSKDPNGRDTKYEYDAFNRLAAIKNHDGNLLQSFSYKMSNSAGCSTPSFTQGADNGSGNGNGNGSCSSLRNPENPGGLVNGLNYKYYLNSGNSNWCQNTSGLAGMTPNKTGQTSAFDLSQKTQDQDFGFEFTGYLDVPADGEYTFYLMSDDEGRVFIGSTEVVNFLGCHGATPEQSGKICLKAGKHAIRVLLTQGGGGADLVVSWEGPGVSKQVIPASRLYRSAGGSSSNPNANGFTQPLVVIVSDIAGQPTTKKRITLTNPVNGARSYRWAVYQVDTYKGSANGYASSNGVFDVDLASLNLSTGTEYRFWVADEADGFPAPNQGYGLFTIGASGCTPPNAPTLSANPGTTINQGQSVTISASGCSGTVNWSWPSGSSSNQTQIVQSPTATTQYSATCTANGCTSSMASITITVNGSGSSGSCGGYAFTENQVIGYVVGGNSIVVKFVGGCASAYWANGGQAHFNWLPQLAGKTVPDEVLLNCLVWEGQTCSGSTSCPQPTITASGSTTIAPGSSASMQTGSSCAGGTIVWKTTAGSQVGQGSSVSVNPTTTTSYVAVCQVGSSCTSANSNTITITVTGTSGCSAQLPDYCWNQTIPANYFHFKSAPTAATIAGPFWSLSTGNPPFYGNAWYLQTGHPSSVIYPPGSNDIDLPVNDYRIDVSSSTTKTAKLYFNGTLKWSQSFSGDVQLHPDWTGLQSGTRVYFVVE